MKTQVRRICFNISNGELERIVEIGIIAEDHSLHTLSADAVGGTIFGAEIFGIDSAMQRKVAATIRQCGCMWPLGKKWLSERGTAG